MTQKVLNNNTITCRLISYHRSC